MYGVGYDVSVLKSEKIEVLYSSTKAHVGGLRLEHWYNPQSLSVLLYISIL